MQIRWMLIITIIGAIILGAGYRLTQVEPETAVAAFASEVEASLLQPLDDMMREQGRDVLLGAVDGEQDGEYYNAMLSLGASGRVGSVHDQFRDLPSVGER